MLKLKILVVEDDFIVAEETRSDLIRIGYEVIATAMDHEEAVHVLQNEKPDFVIIDILLGEGKDGIDLASHIHSNYNIPYIFLSSFADKTTVDRAKQVQPCGYLIKPVDKQRLYAAIEIGLINFAKAGRNIISTDQAKPGFSDIYTKDCMFLKINANYFKIKFGDILFAKSDRNYTELHTAYTTHIVRIALKDFYEKLPQKEFFKVHRSYIAKTAAISKIDQEAVYTGNVKIPLGRTYREALLTQLNTV